MTEVLSSQRSLRLSCWPHFCLWWSIRLGCLSCIPCCKINNTVRHALLVSTQFACWSSLWNFSHWSLCSHQCLFFVCDDGSIIYSTHFIRMRFHSFIVFGLLFSKLCLIYTCFCIKSIFKQIAFLVKLLIDICSFHKITFNKSLVNQSIDLRRSVLIDALPCPYSPGHESTSCSILRLRGSPRSSTISCGIVIRERSLIILVSIQFMGRTRWSPGLIWCTSCYGWASTPGSSILLQALYTLVVSCCTFIECVLLLSGIISP